MGVAYSSRLSENQYYTGGFHVRLKYNNYCCFSDEEQIMTVRLIDLVTMIAIKIVTRIDDD